jgi:hypothetical protein
VWVGPAVGFRVGADVGFGVGLRVGSRVGPGVGDEVGFRVGEELRVGVGAGVGPIVGIGVGSERHQQERPRRSATPSLQPHPRPMPIRPLKKSGKHFHRQASAQRTPCPLRSSQRDRRYGKIS